MFEPVATSLIPDNRAELMAEFVRVANRSFDSCLEAMRKADLYRTVLKRLDRGFSIEDDVPEAKNVSSARLRQVVKNLLDTAIANLKNSWDLESSYRTCFDTSIRMALPEHELIPQFEVEHVAQTDVGEVKIKIKTMRRNVDISIEGDDSSVEKLWGQMSYSVMTFRE